MVGSTEVMVTRDHTIGVIPPYSSSITFRNAETLRDCYLNFCLFLFKFLFLLLEFLPFSENSLKVCGFDRLSC